MLKADGLDAAIIGVGERCGQEDILVYDISKVIDILVDRDGMTTDEAYEFFSFNILGSWVGEKTPMWVREYTEEEGQ